MSGEAVHINPPSISGRDGEKPLPELPWVRVSFRTNLLFLGARVLKDPPICSFLGARVLSDPPSRFEIAGGRRSRTLYLHVVPPGNLTTAMMIRASTETPWPASK